MMDIKHGDMQAAAQQFRQGQAQFQVVNGYKITAWIRDLDARYVQAVRHYAGYAVHRKFVIGIRADNPADQRGNHAFARRRLHENARREDQKNKGQRRPCQTAQPAFSERRDRHN